MDILAEVDKIFPEVIEIRHHLHENPELSEHEIETEKYICKKLDDMQIKYRNHVAGCGVIAQIGEGDHAFAIRADIDALPIQEKNNCSFASKNDGCMHACGHDMHTAILLGTASILKKYEEKITEAGGAVKLLFQPAEETIGGARFMIEEGALENSTVEGITALHIDPMYPTEKILIKHGPMNAGTATFTITVKGASCHGAHPEGGVDSIVVASHVVTALQNISSRMHAPTTPVIVTVGTFNAGVAPNVVAGSAVLRGTSRALDEETLASVTSKIAMISRGVCESFGAECEIVWGDDGYPPLVNDDDINGILEEAAETMYGKDSIIFMPEPSLGADDFAFFTQKIKGAYFNLGSAHPDEEFYPIHSDLFNPDEKTMKRGIAVECYAALKFLKII